MIVVATIRGKRLACPVGVQQRDIVHGSLPRLPLYRQDAYKIAHLLRGGNFPIAYVYPAKWRPTRDLQRRRGHFKQSRAELLTHIQNTVSQYNLPTIGKKLAYMANRDGAAEHFPDLHVRHSIQADLDLIDYYDEVISRLELHLERTAGTHDAHTFYLLKTVPGIGKILGLTLLYEIYSVERTKGALAFPTVTHNGKDANSVPPRGTNYTQSER